MAARCSAPGCGAAATLRCPGCNALYCARAVRDAAHRTGCDVYCAAAAAAAAVGDDAPIGLALTRAPSAAWSSAAAALARFLYLGSSRRACDVAAQLERELTLEVLDRDAANADALMLQDVLTPRPGDRAASRALRREAAQAWRVASLSYDDPKVAPTLLKAATNAAFYASALDDKGERTRLRRFLDALVRVMPTASMGAAKLAVLLAALTGALRMCNSGGREMLSPTVAAQQCPVPLSCKRTAATAATALGVGAARVAAR